MDIHLACFCTSEKFGKKNYYAESIKKLFDSAKTFGIKHFHAYNEKLLPIGEHVRRYMENTKDSGYGFYSWKPLVILDVFDKIKYGDVVIYHDSGRVEYKYEFRKDVTKLVDSVVQNYKGVGIASSHWEHKDWCKRDCFVHMNCNEERYWNLKHLNASWSIWQKNEISIDILNEWKNYCFDPRGTVTTWDTSGPLSDFDSFKEHRWDQAILTNVVHKYIFDKRIPGVFEYTGGWEKDINNFTP